MLEVALKLLEEITECGFKAYIVGGFVRDVDQTEVQKAQKELDEYLTEKEYEEEFSYWRL